MAVYVVTWNLNREANYAAKRAAFVNRLNSHDNVADSALESVRWVSTTLSAAALSADLIQSLDANDSIFVALLAAGTYEGWLTSGTWDWIRARL